MYIYIYTCLFFSYLFIWGGTCKSWQESGGLALGIMIRCLWVRVKGQRLRSSCHKVWSEECGCAYKIAICHNRGCLYWNALWTWLIPRRCKNISAPHDQHCNFFFLDSSFKILVEDHLWIVARARTRARTNLYSNVRNHVATNWFFRCTRISGYGWQACQVQISQSPFSKMVWRWHWNHQRVFERIWFVHIYATPTRSWTTAISLKSGKG